MLFHPILNQLANIDMAFLVKPADEQRIEGQTAFFCPFCQKEEADDDGQGKAKQTPHLIIYNNERGGMYNGVGVDDNTKAEQFQFHNCTIRTRYKNLLILPHSFISIP